MISRKFFRAEREHEVEIGSIVVAKPFWEDAIYQRSVIILLDHDTSGSTGIILNKPSTLAVGEALPVLNTSIPLFYGGTFDSRNISYIHTTPTVPEAIHLGNGLYWGGEFNYIKQLFLDKKMDFTKIKFYAGFVEWGAGELEAEIGNNKWWTSEMTANGLFSTSAENLWAHSLVASGHMYGLFDELPDPSFN